MGWLAWERSTALNINCFEQKPVRILIGRRRIVQHYRQRYGSDNLIYQPQRQTSLSAHGYFSCDEGNRVAGSTLRGGIASVSSR